MATIKPLSVARMKLAGKNLTPDYEKTGLDIDTPCRPGRLIFRGTKVELARVLNRCGASSGYWEAIPHGWQVRGTSSGAIVSWWPKRGTVSVQGEARAAGELDAALRRVLRA